MVDAIERLRNNVVAALRGDPTLAALVHATQADVATRALLRAVTGQADGDIRLVDEDKVFVGLYLFDDDGAQSDDNDIYIEPTVGVGVWIRYTDITALAWGKVSKNGGHVFHSIGSRMQGGRNIGRMPFMEMAAEPGPMRETTTHGGMTSAVVTLRVHCRTNNSNAGDQDCQIMLKRALRAIRNWRFDSDEVGYPPGQGGSNQRHYRDAVDAGISERVRVGRVVTMTSVTNIVWPYSEDTLQE